MTYPVGFVHFFQIFLVYNVKRKLHSFKEKEEDMDLPDFTLSGSRPRHGVDKTLGRPWPMPSTSWPTLWPNLWPTGGQFFKTLRIFWILINVNVSQKLEHIIKVFPKFTNMFALLHLTVPTSRNIKPFSIK